MILEKGQADRFVRLFNQLMEFSARYLVRRGAFSAEQMGSDASFGQAMLRAIWGEGGDLGVLDAFVRAKAHSLSSRDVEAVLSWRRGLLALFPIGRIGDDTTFLYGDHVFFVRGITREIDRTLSLPDFAEGVIVPFDGLITYGTVLMQDPAIQVQEGMKESILEQMRACIDAGRSARTADEFERAVVEARAARERSRAEHEEWQQAMDAGADEVVEGQRRSPLADLDWDARVQAFEAHRREQDRIFISESLDDSCIHAPVATTLVGCLEGMTRVELVELAEAGDLDGSPRSMGKAELAQAIAGSTDFNAFDFIVMSALRRATDIRTLRDVVRAGGRLDFVADDIASAGDTPLAVMPALWVFGSDDGYSVVVPDEYQGLLAEQPDDLYDSCAEQAKILDSLIRRIEVMVDLRGVVPKSEVMAYLDRAVDKGDLSFCQLGLDLRASGLNAVFREARVRGLRDGAYVHLDLIDPSPDATGAYTMEYTELAAEIMRRRGRFPTRGWDEFEDVPALYAWMRTHESYRELVTYLDGRVPEGIDERAWAIDYADTIVHAARAAWGTKDVLDLMRAEDLDLSEAQHVRVTELIGDLLNDVPRWTNGGWSPNELRHVWPRDGVASSDIKVTPRRQRRKRPHKKRRR